jgi:ABC-2 type transport system ATP-binding protein
MAPLLEFNAVSKLFGGYTALDQLTLTLEPGEILGFLGPNGAGKTTAIHLALGLLRPSSGTGSLLGKPFGEAQARARLGFVPDMPVFFAEPASSTVEFAARLNGVRHPQLQESIRSLLATVGLPQDGKQDGKDAARDARKFSRGMQQRLALAQALINDPELLILDEPASALDPAGVLQVRELLRHARETGKSVFFSSHQLTEVEHICDRIAFLRAGRLVRYGKLDALLKESNSMEARIRGASGIESKRIFPREEQRRVLEEVWSSGGEIMSLTAVRQTLEELFLNWSESENAPGSER